MQRQSCGVTRRAFLTSGGAGVVAAVATRPLEAAQQTAAEQSNIAAVNDFCATFVVPMDWDKMASFLAADCKFRGSQTLPMVEGSDAIVEFLKGFAGNATAMSFEVFDTWARGPVVVNHRVDKFVLPENSIEATVVGVFYLVDGKIAEWTDYVSDPGA